MNTEVKDSMNRPGTPGTGVPENTADKEPVLFSLIEFPGGESAILIAERLDVVVDYLSDISCNPEMMRRCTGHHERSGIFSGTPFEDQRQSVTYMFPLMADTLADLLRYATENLDTPVLLKALKDISEVYIKKLSADIPGFIKWDPERVVRRSVDVLSRFMSYSGESKSIAERVLAAVTGADVEKSQSGTPEIEPYEFLKYAMSTDYSGGLFTGESDTLSADACIADSVFVHTLVTIGLINTLREETGKAGSIGLSQLISELYTPCPDPDNVKCPYRMITGQSCFGGSGCCMFRRYLYCGTWVMR